MASNPPPQVQKLFGSGKTLIVGVNSVGAIYYRNENSNFQNLVGLAKHMSVGPLGLFGIGLLDEMYFYKGNNFLGVADWQKLAGNAKTITSGKNSVLVTHPTYMVSKMTDIKQPIGNELKYDWSQIDGKFALIASSPDHNSIWAITTTGDCYFKQSLRDDAKWEQITGFG